MTTYAKAPALADARRTARAARRDRMLTRVALVVLASVLQAVSAARAAETTATFVGRVTDERGTAVASARITAAAPSGRFDTKTDGAGRFTLIAVSPDTYVVTVTANGYDALRRDGVTAPPGARVTLTLVLHRALRVIGHIAVTPAFASGTTRDAYTIAGEAARGPTVASGAGLGTYNEGTVQAAIVGVPGVQEDQFAHAIVRGGRVDDTVFTYDAVPVPQALIAEPGGNVVGAQLPTTGVGFTTLTTGGFTNGGDDALAATVDQTPLVGVYPARTTVSSGIELIPGARDVEVQSLGATPSLRERYAFDGTIGSERIAYGDGHTFYPAEAGTYGLALSSRATWSTSANVHVALGARDDLELLELAGEATYDQYATPFTGERYGTFDGDLLSFPAQPSPTAFVTTPTRVRGTYAIEKLQLLRRYDRASVRLRLYRSQYGSDTNAPFFDDLSYPNGVISYLGRQSGDLRGFGIDVMDLGSATNELDYGAELRNERSALDQLIPTLDEHFVAAPLLTSQLAFVSDAVTPLAALTLQGALRYNATLVARSDGYRYAMSALDPHLALVTRLPRAAGDVRLTFDHTTVPPNPLEVQRGDGGPFAPLAPQRGDSYALTYERNSPARVRVSVFSKNDRDRIDVLPSNERPTSSAGASPGTALGIPQNAGALIANGVETSLETGPVGLSLTYVHARSSSASQFGLNDLNAPALAAGHLFPVGYIPALSASATLHLKVRRLTFVPTLSWQSGYPYGNGRRVYVFNANGQPISVLNDDHVNPGYNYYFLRNPALPYDALGNPVIATLGTPEGDDPNSLNSGAQLLASLHAEAPLGARVEIALDVDNLFATASPEQLQGNPYLIGPPGYRGGNPLRGAWYGNGLGVPSYGLGNGVPTNDGLTSPVPWTYGTGAYVPSSYPEARSLAVRLRVHI